MSLDSIYPLVVSFLGAVGGASIGGWVQRTNAKKVPKTERRADAYGDFARYVVHQAAHGAAPPEQDLDEILARIMIFGENEVVDAVAAFLESGGALQGSSQAAFVGVIVAMRESLATSSSDPEVSRILAQRRGTWPVSTADTPGKD